MSHIRSPQYYYPISIRRLISIRIGSPHTHIPHKRPDSGTLLNQILCAKLFQEMPERRATDRISLAQPVLRREEASCNPERCYSPSRRNTATIGA